MNRFRRFVVFATLISGLIAFPVIAQESTEVPTDVAPTAEATVEPTIAPEPTPAPVPPIDVTVVPSWVFVVITVLVLGVVVIAHTGIVQAAKGMPSWAQEMVLSAVKTGLQEAGRIARDSETTVDDAAIEELRKQVERLEAELRATRAPSA